MDGITEYGVTDLVLHSAEDLTALAAALETRGMRVTQRALQIHETAREFFRIAETDRMWIFQLDGCGSYDDPEPEVAAMLAAVEADGCEPYDGPEPEVAAMLAAVEADGCEPNDGPEPAVAAMLAAVEALDPPERAAWDGCSRREFDIAYDCGVRPFSVRHDLSAGMLARLAAAGGSLRLTLYALDPKEIQPAEPGAAPDPAA